jgi:hypothetical protein
VAELKVLWLTLVPAHVVVDLWQVSQVAVVAMWFPERTVAVVPPLWQVAQPEFTEKLTWNLAGNQLG